MHRNTSRVHQFVSTRHFPIATNVVIDAEVSSVISLAQSPSGSMAPPAVAAPRSTQSDCVSFTNGSGESLGQASTFTFSGHTVSYCRNLNGSNLPARRDKVRAVPRDDLEGEKRG